MYMGIRKCIVGEGLDPADEIQKDFRISRREIKGIMTQCAICKGTISSII